MLRHKLQQREADGNPIQVGATGAGWMGSGFVHAMQHVPGMVLNLYATETIEAGIAAFKGTGIAADDIIVTDQPNVAMDAIKQGKRVVSSDITLPAKVDGIDIVTDVTWSPASGATVTEACINFGKDIVLVNIEADVTVGRALKKRAEAAGVLYSVSSGDEPGCLLELYDFVTTIGHEVIVIGKGKNNPLNPAATPLTVADAATKADKDPYQVASYVDGTKTMFEMTCAANATGCRPMQDGMTGPYADLSNVAEIFALVEDGGTVKAPGTIDFVQGEAMAGGIFIVVHVDDQRIRDDLNYLKVGKGKYFAFFRPYHLWFLEAPISIARAHLDRTVWLAPLDQPIAENIAIAKRDLVPGETLDEAGGYTTHGLMMTAEKAYAKNALPVGLTPGAKVKRMVAQGSPLTWDDVTLDETSAVVQLRREQDTMAQAYFEKG